MSTADPNLAAKKERWDVRLKQADVVYKVLILIIGSIVAALFLVVQNKQTNSRYYADLMAERERADTELRAEMFKVLFEAYFKNKIQVEESQEAVRQSPGLSEGRRKVLEGLRHETMLSDLLARNFENIDIRPLLEDLDDRLGRAMTPSSGRTADEPDDAQREAFRQRQLLRRVASGATARQIAALEGLSGKARARVSYHGIDTCKPTLGKVAKEQITNGQPMHAVTPPVPAVVEAESGPMRLVALKDGALEFTIFYLPREPAIVRSFQWSRLWDRFTAFLGLSPATHPSSAANDTPADLGASSMPLSVTFFDMPALEHIRLKNDERVAFSLHKYVSKRDCARFGEVLDERARQDCSYPLSSARDDCVVAQFRTVILPKEFLGIHDRPYVNDLAAGKYSEPLLKLW